MVIQLFDNSVPRNLRGPALVDEYGLPRYWASVWSAMSAAHLADSTHLKKLRHIEHLYQHADLLLGWAALDDALGTLNDDVLATILESWFVSIRNQPRTTEGDEKRWQTGLGFVSSVLTWVSKSQAGHLIRSIEERLQPLSLLYRQLHVHKAKPIETIRSLPATTVETLYELLDPESSLNPFPRSRTRWRVFVSFILMLHQGLRRGEVLLLPVDCIKSAFDPKQGRIRYWINVQENPYEDTGSDPRYSKPGIKTAASIRQVPVSEATAHTIDSYAQNFRGQPQHSFLLNSQANMPLSTEALTKAFTKVSQRLPADVLKQLSDRAGKRSVTPHDLRHTSAVMRLHQLLQQGDSLEESLQKLRTFFGWSKTSAMPSRYARAVFEDRLATVWNDAFDDRAALLRALPKGR
ncbi:site-specific integrase [Noviherbaspirillum sp. Root189]|uniref:site-specific integrase n=1 Tax=Noviherbaspirillum sp. Root189 TaxID=1736487 RepID=UPI0007094D98|nr:site-specific integrase [Noviherbaspirillum sp. Root189]KRB81050.1 integrase [Noviherbaspirillum sp. Root189]